MILDVGKGHTAAGQILVPIVVEAETRRVLKGESKSVTLTAKHPTMHVKKPGLVFRVAGNDDQQLLLDRVQIWQ